jgi:phage repressor protein C with HTH and peptisase S24 domain
MPSRSVRGVHGEEVGGGQLDPRDTGTGQNRGLDMVGDRTPDLPALDSRNGLPDGSGHGADSAELVDDVRNVGHGRKCSLLAYALSTAKCGQTERPRCAHNADMTEGTETHVALQLKALREKAGLSVRRAAMAMKMAASSYGHYEDPARLKGPLLPLEFARRFAAVIEAEGVDPAESLRLAGVGSVTDVLSERTPDDLVPIYDVQVSAGNGIIPHDSDLIVGHLALPPGYLRHITSAPVENLAIVTVRGGSMEPTLRDRDVVLIDTTKRSLGYDGLFVIRMDEGALHVKRIGRGPHPGTVAVISDNPNSPDVVRALDQVESVGKVLWYGRKE